MIARAFCIVEAQHAPAPAVRRRSRALLAFGRLDAYCAATGHADLVHVLAKFSNRLADASERLVADGGDGRVPHALANQLTPRPAGYGQRPVSARTTRRYLAHLVAAGVGATSRAGFAPRQADRTVRFDLPILPANLPQNRSFVAPMAVKGPTWRWLDDYRGRHRVRRPAPVQAPCLHPSLLDALDAALVAASARPAHPKARTACGRLRGPDGRFRPVDRPRKAQTDKTNTIQPPAAGRPVLPAAAAAPPVVLDAAPRLERSAPAPAWVPPPARVECSTTPGPATVHEAGPPAGELAGSCWKKKEAQVNKDDRPAPERARAPAGTTVSFFDRLRDKQAAWRAQMAATDRVTFDWHGPQNPPRGQAVREAEERERQLPGVTAAVARRQAGKKWRRAAAVRQFDDDAQLGDPVWLAHGLRLQGALWGVNTNQLAREGIRRGVWRAALGALLQRPPGVVRSPAAYLVQVARALAKGTRVDPRLLPHYVAAPGWPRELYGCAGVRDAEGGDSG